MASETTPRVDSESRVQDVSSLDAAKSYASSRRKAVGYSLLGAVLFFAIWALASQFQRTEFELLPSPLEVGARMWGFIFGDEARGVAPGTVFINFFDTLLKTMYGFLGAVVVGVPIGILMGRFKYAKNFFFDFIYLAANVPLIIYAILSLVLFGLSDTGPAVVVALLVLPIVALNVAAGVEGVDQNLLAMSRAYGLPTRSAVRSIVVPSFMPFFFGATRASFAASWKLAALVETFGGVTGVGVQIRKAFQGFSVADMLAWMMFFVIFVIIVERFVLIRLERYVFRYRLKRGEDMLRF